MPIFTTEELTSQITAYKEALLALATAEEYTINLPDGSRQTVRRSALPEIRKQLEWLQSQLDNQSSSDSAPVGRTFAKQGGGGRW